MKVYTAKIRTFVEKTVWFMSEEPLSPQRINEMDSATTEIEFYGALRGGTTIIRDVEDKRGFEPLSVVKFPLKTVADFHSKKKWSLYLEYDGVKYAVRFEDSSLKAKEDSTKILLETKDKDEAEKVFKSSRDLLLGQEAWR